MTGHLTALGETVQVNTVLIQGQIAVSSVADCGEYLDHNSSPSSPPYLLDGNVNIHMWFTKSDIFFVVCIVLTFQKILLGGILDGPFLSLTGCGFWVFIP